MEVKQLRTLISHGEEGSVGGRQHKLIWRVYTYQRGNWHGPVSAIRWPSFGTDTAGTTMIGEVLVLIVSPVHFTRTRVVLNIGCSAGGKVHQDFFVEGLTLVTTSTGASVFMHRVFYWDRVFFNRRTLNSLFWDGNFLHVRRPLLHSGEHIDTLYIQRIRTRYK